MLGPGQHTLSVAFTPAGTTDHTAADAMTTIAVHYVFAWQPPIANADSFRTGRTILAAFTLAERHCGLDRDGTARGLGGPSGENVAPAGAAFAFSIDQYQYNWRTDGLSPGTYSVTAVLDDGTNILVAMRSGGRPR